jgi:hypothetical protein
LNLKKTPEHSWDEGVAELELHVTVKIIVHHGLYKVCTMCVCSQQCEWSRTEGFYATVSSQEHVKLWP